MKAAIILAGGKGTRMKSEMPKVMCEVIFEPMISYVVNAVKEAGVEDICVITGYKHEIVENYLSELDSNIKPRFSSPNSERDTQLCRQGNLFRVIWKTIYLS